MDEVKRRYAPITTAQFTSTHGTVTVFGEAWLSSDPPDDEGRVRVALRYESRSLWLWLHKHPEEVFTVDTWAPVPPIKQGEGRLPWLRTTAERVQFRHHRHDRESGTYVSVGVAERHPRTGEVLRHRQDLTTPDSEAAAGA